MNYLLGIDIGTSGTKALLINASKDGEVVAASTRTYPLYTPKPQWAEQEPEDWWQASVSAISDCIEAAGIEPKKIRASVCRDRCTGRSSSTRTNRVLRPAILWCDQRTAGRVRVDNRQGRRGAARRAYQQPLS